jgi:prevent-host-death family protein
MNTVTATYAKQNFGACVAEAAKQPVIIEKSGRASVVMLSYEEFLRLSELEDAAWLRRAEQAAASGYLSVDESDEFMKRRLEKSANNLST